MKGRLPLLWPGWTAPKERATRDQGLCSCARVNHSRRPPIITLSERAVGRNWRWGPQLSQGLVGGLQWLIAFPHTQEHMHRCTPRPPHDPAWHPMNTGEGRGTQNAGTKTNTQGSSKPMRYTLKAEVHNKTKVIQEYTLTHIHNWDGPVYFLIKVLGSAAVQTCGRVVLSHVWFLVVALSSLLLLCQ